METKYFDASGREVLVGLNIATPEEAAYSTTNPQDPIMTRPSPGYRWEVVNGVPTQVKRTLDSNDLRNFIKKERDEAIKRGVLITSTYMVNGNVVSGHTQAIRLTDRIRADVSALAIDYNLVNPGSTATTPLKVGTSIYLLLSGASQVNALHTAGKELITLAYSMEAQCIAVLDTTSSKDYASIQQTLRQMWATVKVEKTI